MTTAEMLRAEGRNEGRNEGRAEALAQILTIRFGQLPGDIFAKLRAAPGGQLQTWTERAVTASTLEEVFR